MPESFPANGYTPGVGDDHVDAALESWRQATPELDASPLAVMERISRLSALLERQLEPVLSPHSVSLGEFDVLAVLRREGPPFRLTPTRLTAALLVTSGGMTKRLAALERAGLVQRLVDPADRRSRAVELTDAGRELVDQVMASRLKHEKRLLAGLRKRQRRDLAATLRDLCLALGDDAPPGASRTRRSRPR